MKHREFKAHGFRFAIVGSNNNNFKWQAIVFDTDYNAWVRICYYANTQNELKDFVKECYKSF